MNLQGVYIKSIAGIAFDEIIEWVIDSGGKATVKYIYQGKERLISLESEAIKIEFTTDV